MPISFPCPSCSRRVRVSRKHAGKRGWCPKCGAKVEVPRLELADVSTEGSGELPSFQTLIDSQRMKLEREALDRERRRLEEQRRELEEAREYYDNEQGRRELEAINADLRGDLPLSNSLAPSPAGAAPSPPPVPPVEDPDRIECPACAESIKARAKVCRFCGHELGMAVGQEPRAPGRKRRLRRGKSDSAVNLLAAQRADSLALTSFVLGVVGFFLCGILAPVAIMQGHESIRMAEAARIRRPALASLGIVLGWIVVGVWLVGLALVLASRAGHL